MQSFENLLEKIVTPMPINMHSPPTLHTIFKWLAVFIDMGDHSDSGGVMIVAIRLITSSFFSIKITRSYTGLPPF